MTPGCQHEERTYTTGQAAPLIGLPPWKVVYLISTGRLPDVRRVGILRCWTQADIDRARRLLAEEGR